MVSNYFFLKPLAQALNKALTGTYIEACFTQNRNEIIVGFARPGHDYYLKILLDGKFNSIQILTEFARQHRNSVDLFSTLLGGQVRHVRAAQYNRCLIFELEQPAGSFAVQFYGSMANAVWFNANGQAVEWFRKQLAGRHENTVNELNKTYDTSRPHFDSQNGNYKKILPPLGREFNQMATQAGYSDLTIDEKWQFFNHWLNQLHQTKTYYLTHWNSQWQLLLFEAGQVANTYQSAMEATNAHARLVGRSFYLENEKKALITLLEQKIKKDDNYLKKSETRLEQLLEAPNPKLYADLLMAYAHLVKPGDKIAQLPHFETGQPVPINIKPNLSPHKNAERYYRKAQNQGIELQHLEKQTNIRQQRLTELRQTLEQVHQTDDFKWLRQLKKDYTQTTRPEDKSALPYHEFSYKGYDIMIGKGKNGNEHLLHRAHKENWWLHVKDLPGAHVIVPHQGNSNLPQPVAEVAAGLAAWFSKDKNATLSPVTLTRRKYVTKRRGAGPGQVTFTNEQVLMVQPLNPANLKPQ